MNENEYWISLEYRVCHEFAGMPEIHLRNLWCDGFIPDQYSLEGASPCVTGRVWICNGPKQEQWQFTLFMNHLVTSELHVDWSSLLPPRNKTNWLLVDLTHRSIRIDLSEAVDDVETPKPRVGDIGSSVM